MDFTVLKLRAPNPFNTIFLTLILPRKTVNFIFILAPAGSSKSVTFLLTWHFPNRQTWTPIQKDETNKIC